MTRQTTTFPPGEAAELFELLGRQRDLYSELAGLSAQQSGLIADGEAEALLTVLSRRQSLVEQLGVINDQIGPYRGRVPQIAESLPGAQREALRSLVDQVQELLKSIIDQDDRDRAQLEAARTQVSDEATRAARAGVALGAYRQQPARPTARFADHAG